METPTTPARYCKVHAEHDDDCLGCAIDHAVDRSPNGNSMVGLGLLIPERMRFAYLDLVVSGTARAIRAEQAS